MSVLAPLYRPLWKRDTYAASGYFLWGFVTSILWFTLLVAAYATSLALVVVWVGVPLLALTHRWSRWVGDIERRQVNMFLGLNVPPAPPFTTPTFQFNDHRRIAQFGTWMHTVFHDPYTWRALSWTAMRLVLGPVGFALAVIVWVTLPVLALAPLALLLPGVSLPDGYGGLAWVTTAGPVAAFIIAPMLVWSIKGWASVHAMAARWTLGPCEHERTKAALHRAELAEQQVRIDQELHDSIGHMITMNVVQAGAGAHVFDSDPEFARRALQLIEVRGRVAMSELDRIIATMRGDHAEPRAPLPELADISDLAVASRNAGVEVDLVLTQATVPAVLGRAAYAIVREGVTNAAKHAPGASVHVHVDADSSGLAIAVINAPPAGPKTETGAGRDVDPGTRSGARLGLAGIRDRVTLLGGYSDIGPTEEGGYEVLALLPLDAELGELNGQDQCACCMWTRLRDRLTV